MLTGVRGGGRGGGGGWGTEGGGGRGGGGRPARAVSEVKRGEGAERSSASRSVRSIPERKTSSPLGVRPKLPHTQVTETCAETRWSELFFFVLCVFPAPRPRCAQLSSRRTKKFGKEPRSSCWCGGISVFCSQRRDLWRSSSRSWWTEEEEEEEERQQRVSRLRPCAPPKNTTRCFLSSLLRALCSLLSFILKEQSF